jgi:hypothetical protein
LAIFVQISAIFWSKFQILFCAFRPEFLENLPNFEFRISPISPRSGKNRKQKTETLRGFLVSIRFLILTWFVRVARGTPRSASVRAGISLPAGPKKPRRSQPEPNNPPGQKEGSNL